MRAFRIVSMALPLVLAACGGGSSSDMGALASPATLRGQYVDAPTAGLRYAATPSGLSGTTDTSGNFNFVAGDTVQFSIQSSDASVTIPLGTIAPVAPTNSSNTSIVNVLTLPNGTETAQAIQSFANNGNDFRSVAVSAANATALKAFIDSGGVTPAPTPPGGTFVSPDDALNTALQYVSNLPVQPVGNVANAISGQTFFSVSTFTDSGGTVHPNASIVYLAPNGSYYQICTNTIFNGLTPNPCSVNNGNPVSHVGNWAVVANATNAFTLSGTAFDGVGNTSYVSTITAPILDTSKGIFTTSQTNDGTANAGTGVGKYQTVQSAFSISSLAGKSFAVSGFNACVDGRRQYAFQQVSGNTLPYGWTCPAGYAIGSTATSGVASNAVIAGTNIPGVVAMTDAGSTDPLYVGVTTDSKLAGGIALVAKVGNAAAGCSYATPANCKGYVKARAFTLQ